MNMQVPGVMAPPPPKTLEAMSLSPVMIRDILIKTMFRTNLENVSAIAKAICLPVNVTQQIVDAARDLRLCEATGTLNANNGNEMGYQLTDAGKARALDALAQSEYFGAMPVPLEQFLTVFVTLWAIKSMYRARLNTRARSSQSMTRLCIPAPKKTWMTPMSYAARLGGMTPAM